MTKIPVVDGTFTEKHPDLKALMEVAGKAAGGSGKRTYGKCALCPREFNPETEFNDELSKTEYRISGMCQTCQNKTFVDEEE